LPVVLFHHVSGRWVPACLRAATVSVETVAPPLDATRISPQRIACQIVGQNVSSKCPRESQSPRNRCDDPRLGVRRAKRQERAPSNVSGVSRLSSLPSQRSNQVCKLRIPQDQILPLSGVIVLVLKSRRHGCPQQGVFPAGANS
jgi:hypothetical protein